ncbi:MAG: FG-GAP repeat protein, partial [Acidobacteriota bacterium]
SKTVRGSVVATGVVLGLLAASPGVRATTGSVGSFAWLPSGRDARTHAIDETKLVADDGQPGDMFGWSVSVHGGVAVVGVLGDDGGGSQAGAARVFSRGDAGWEEVKKLVASDAEAGDAFGLSVSVDEDVAIAGAPWEDAAGARAGAAYVFVRDVGGADHWGEVRKLSASDARIGSTFGASVSISGDTILVGADGDRDAGLQSGAAYIFVRDEGGAGNWGEVRKLTASDAEAGDRFGYSVSISGDTAVVGAFGEDDLGAFTGRAYIFGRDEGGVDQWGQVAVLTASDAAVGDNFGFTVAGGEEIVVVGALGQDEAGDNAGAAYVFSRDEGGPAAWGELAKLTASDAADGDGFGYSVAVGENRVIVGAQSEDTAGLSAGATYVFSRDEGGPAAWGESVKLLASDGAAGDQFGLAVAASGDIAVVGAFGADAGADGSGAAYVHDLGTEEEDACPDNATRSDPADCGCDMNCASFDFEGLEPGTSVSTQFVGVTLSGSAPVHSFDTTAPTCGDDDLAAPGPGLGNDVFLGDVLVLSEDGSCTPDDAARGGTMTLLFDVPVEVSSVGLLDIDADEDEGHVRAFDALGRSIIEVPIPALGDNSWQAVRLEACGVVRLEIHLDGSGAVTNIGCDSAVTEPGLLGTRGTRPSEPDRGRGHRLAGPGEWSRRFGERRGR